jgi:PAS domain S-box-containing protein
VVLFVIGRFSLDITKASQALFVPIPAVVAAGFTALISIVAYIRGREKAPYLYALITYVATTFTIVMLLTWTGGAWSPFVALWLLVGVFAGLFGWYVWIALWVAANIALLYDLFFAGKSLGGDRILGMVLVAEAPMLVSYIIWHKDGGTGTAAQADKLAAQLSQVANKSDIVINAIADGVVAIDGRGTIQLINPAAQTMLGWPKQDAIGLDYRSVIKLGDSKGNPVPDDFSPIHQVLVSNKSLVNNDLELTTKSGKKLLVSLMVSPVSEDETASTGAIAVFRDITREKEEERQKAEFISTASHEMRTPVAAIEGYLGLAMNPQTATIDEKAKSYLQKAHESTQHLGRLFQDLLTVSKAEDARLIPKPSVVDTIALVREIVQGLQQKAHDKGLFLAFKPAESDNEGNRKMLPIYYSYADQDQMREVLNNLVDNAIKYTKQGTVTVDVTGTNEAITVSVTDTGLGIPPEDVPHLFQKFYRVDNSDTREIGGTGLGLYISRRLTEANNGHIGVNSTYGKGSTFYVQLPRISHDQANAIINAAAAQQPRAV